MNEVPWQAEIAVGAFALVGSIWLATTGRLIGERIHSAAEKLARAGAVACLGVAITAQATQHWIDHWVELTAVTLGAGTVALVLASWSWIVRRRHV